MTAAMISTPKGFAKGFLIASYAAVAFAGQTVGSVMAHRFQQAVAHRPLVLLIYNQ